MEISMVEINTMASSFGGLAENIPQLHRLVHVWTNAVLEIDEIPECCYTSALVLAQIGESEGELGFIFQQTDFHTMARGGGGGGGYMPFPSIPQLKTPLPPLPLDQPTMQLTDQPNQLLVINCLFWGIIFCSSFKWQKLVEYGFMLVPGTFFIDTSSK